MEKKWKFDSNLDKIKHSLREMGDFSLIWLGLYGEKGRKEEEKKKKEEGRGEEKKSRLAVWKFGN